MHSGECKCKANVIGDKCDQCREGSSRLTLENPMGCYSHPEQQAPPIKVAEIIYLFVNTALTNMLETNTNGIPPSPIRHPAF